MALELLGNVASYHNDGGAVSLVVAKTMDMENEKSPDFFFLRFYREKWTWGVSRMIECLATRSYYWEGAIIYIDDTPRSSRCDAILYRDGGVNIFGGAHVNIYIWARARQYILARHVNIYWRATR